MISKKCFNELSLFLSTYHFIPFDLLNFSLENRKLTSLSSLPKMNTDALFEYFQIKIENIKKKDENINFSQELAEISKHVMFEFIKIMKLEHFKKGILLENLFNCFIGTFQTYLRILTGNSEKDLENKRKNYEKLSSELTTNEKRKEEKIRQLTKEKVDLTLSNKFLQSQVEKSKAMILQYNEFFYFYQPKMKKFHKAYDEFKTLTQSILDTEGLMSEIPTEDNRKTLKEEITKTKILIERLNPIIDEFKSADIIDQIFVFS